MSPCLVSLSSLCPSLIRAFFFFLSLSVFFVSVSFFLSLACPATAKKGGRCPWGNWGVTGGVTRVGILAKFFATPSYHPSYPPSYHPSYPARKNHAVTSELPTSYPGVTSETVLHCYMCLHLVHTMSQSPPSAVGNGISLANAEIINFYSIYYYCASMCMRTV